MNVDRGQVRAVVRKLERDGPEGADEARMRLRAMGAVAGIHVGRAPDSFTENEAVEWYAGQVLYALEQAPLPSGFVMQSVFNVLDKFVPEVAEATVYPALMTQVGKEPPAPSAPWPVTPSFVPPKREGGEGDT